ncbi:MAG: hypothetical protein QXP77_00110 [Candidatus Aenigmatarchaeota archaeon]
MAKKKKEGSGLSWEQLYAKFSQPAQVKSSTFSLSVGGEKIAQKKSTPPLKKKEEGYGFSIKTQAAPSTSSTSTQKKKEKEVIKPEPTKKPEKDKKGEGQRWAHPTYKKCPKCETEFDAEHYHGKCPNCGTNILVPPKIPKVSKCPRCGSEKVKTIGKYLFKCEECGYEWKKKGFLEKISDGLKGTITQKETKEKEGGKEKQGIKGIAIGGILSGSLYLLSNYHLLPIPTDPLLLVGIFACCILLSFKSNAAKAIGILVLIGIIVFYAMSIPMVQALIPMRQINDVIYELNIKKDYVQCLMTHLTDVENIMNYGGLEALCKRLLTEVKAVKEGCTECLTLKVSTEVPMVTPGSSFLFRLEYSMSDGADLPARDIITRFYVDNETENVTRCEESKPCTLYPGDFEESSVKLNKSETENFCLKEKDYFKYIVSTNYNYTSRGYTHFYITNNIRIYEKRTAITSSGPLDIIISSDSSYYKKDEDTTIFLAFALVNKGEGDIKINSFKIVELNPLNESYSLLKQASCDVGSSSNSVWDVNINVWPLNVSIKSGKKIMFGCSISIPNNFKILSLPGPFVTYTYEAIANYTYSKNQTGQVWIYKDYCDFYKSQPSGTQPSETGTQPSKLPGGCLVEDSLILTPEGFKKIQELKEGDYVVGYKDGKKVNSRILEKSFHEGEFEVYFYKGYWFTGNHMVYLDNYEEFRRVDELSNIKGSFRGRIYNIQTETQNYFGDNGLLIHNK